MEILESEPGHFYAGNLGLTRQERDKAVDLFMEQRKLEMREWSLE